MKIWLDTIDCAVIADGVRTGIVCGITTNPSILSKAGHVQDTLHRLLDIQPGPVAVQVTTQSPEEIIDEARNLFAFSSRLIIKIPVNYNGLIAITQLRKEQIPLLGTAVLSTRQALLAATHHVSYIAPYFSHMGEASDAFATLKIMAETIKIHRSPTQILVASVKQLDHVIYCAHLGVEAVTIKPDLYAQLVADNAIAESFTHQFLSEWREAQGGRSFKEALSVQASPFL